MSTSSGSDYSGAIFVILLVMMFNADWNPSGKHTIYVASCPGGWSGKECVHDLVAAQQITYLAKAGDSHVTYWDDQDNGGPYLLTDCAIQDVENWRCLQRVTATDSWAIRMVDGKLTGELGVPSYPQVSWWRWYLLRWGIATRQLRFADH